MLFPLLNKLSHIKKIRFINQKHILYKSGFGSIRSSSSAQGSMQLQYCLIKRRNPNMADTTIFSTSIYGISVTFADVITSDMPIIINNYVIA